MSRNATYDALLNLGNSPDENTIELARRYQAVFGTADSALVMEDLKRKFWMYDTTADERFTEMNEGNRQVVLYIMMMLGVDTGIKIGGENDSE
jgi:hypothetical protein